MIYQAIVFFAIEVILLFIASSHSPGYCVEMEGEMDVEKTSLLNKESSNSSKRGALCKECGIKRPLRSCHCPEYDFVSSFYPDVIDALFVLIIMILLLIIVLGLGISNTTYFS